MIGGDLRDDIAQIYASMWGGHPDHNMDHLHPYHTRSLLSTGGDVSAAEKGWTYGIGGYQPVNKIGYSLQYGMVVACDWVGFLCLAAAAGSLMYKLFSFKGPDGDQDFFIGYREEKCISIFVNLIAAMTYWGRICAHFNGDVGLALSVNFYKYLDYIFTCPILTLDLLWSLNLPYKVTYSIFVAITITAGVFCNAFEPPGRYLWFFFSASVFVFTWFSIIKMVYCRFQQFMNDDAKKIRAPLKLSLTLYFTIWCGYPALWILDEFGLIPGIAVHVLSMIMDVAAKSVYGFALLKFQLGVDKQDFAFGELKTLKLAAGTIQMPDQIRSSKARNLSRHNDNYDDDDQPFDTMYKSQSRMQDDGWNNQSRGAPRQEEDIEKTMSQIAHLNQQLDTLQGATLHQDDRR